MPNPQKKPYGINDFLWNLAGFKRSIIAKTKIDKFHAAVIGALLLMVGLYATIAWSFFFQTLGGNIILTIVAGLFMGAFIIAFDRALIASMASGKANVFSLGFRLVLAILLGVFLSQPIILRLYAPEIKRESQILLDKKIAERKTELTAVYQNELNSLALQKSTLENQLTEQKNLVVQAEKDFKKEMDGSGGTKKYGYSTVSKQKEKILESHVGSLEQMNATHQPQITTLQNNINTINDKIFNEVEMYRSENKEFGTLIQAEALQSLLKKDTSGALTMRYYLLSFILTLIELSALIAKIFLKTPAYRSKVELMNESADLEINTQREILLARNKIYKEKALESELALTEQFFDKTQSVKDEKFETQLQDWRTSKELTYKNTWNRFKKAFFLLE
jgi:Domain of unknown function (DUF4407)